jgi:GT2 family glycosyltransferase
MAAPEKRRPATNGSEHPPREVAALREALQDQASEISSLHEILDLLIAGDASALGPEAKVAMERLRRVRQVVQAARKHVPAGAVVLVSGDGADELLRLGGVEAWPFPRPAAGEAVAQLPLDPLSAIAQLAALRSEGAGYLLLHGPNAVSRLGQNPGFQLYLERHYPIALRSDVCTIFTLNPSLSSAAGAGLAGFEKVIAECEDRLGVEPSILDWNTGLALSSAFPGRMAFSPSGQETRLLYADRSVDIVALASTTPAALAEARRVAAAAVVKVGRPEGAAEAVSFEVEWTLDRKQLAQPSTTIIIPSYNGVELLRVCLRALQETLPTEAEVEILVADDGSTDATPEFIAEWSKQDPRVKLLLSKRNTGFIATCNRGLAAATGEIVVFLNNDTVPLRGWLPPLLRTFRERPDAGAVGGRLVYPTGLLQEAGGVIFRDGSGANFGRDDPSPSAPLYSFLRPVDYCSGALLATPRALCQKLGGFDSLYAPAYYEDTDYCFKIRQEGLTVYYQPESSIVHLEGATSGTDISSGAKRYQAVNLAKFKKRWDGALKKQPRNPNHWDFAVWHGLAVRDSMAGARQQAPKVRRILVCAPAMPEFDRESGSRRIFDLLMFLVEGGWAVTFVAQRAPDGERYQRLLRQHGINVFVGFDQLTDLIISTGHYEVALFEFWDTAEQHLPYVRRASPTTRVIVDSIDLHFMRHARRAFMDSDGSENLLDHKFGSEVVRELNVYAASDAVLAVSQKEADLIGDLLGQTTLSRRVPDSEELEESPLPFEARNGILFLGSFRHTPNVDAMEFLCRKVLPLVDPALLRAHPLLVVGTGLNDTIRGFAKDLPNVRLIGWVPSVTPYLQQARVSVIPLLYGAGTKRKLVQALMSGTPSVSTSIGVEGLELTDGKEVLIAEQPAAFAEAITRLLKEAKLWSKIAKQGRAHVLPRQGRNAAKSIFLATIETVLTQKSKRSRHPPASPDHNYRISMHYQRLLRHVREAVASHVPAGSNVVVVSKGDDELVRLDGRQGWHFPQDAAGVYAGYYPADSGAAIQHLQELCGKGADFLVVPAAGFWWLDHYQELTEHLTNVHREVMTGEHCRIFDLRKGG